MSPTVHSLIQRSPKGLWHLPPKDFNAWRKQHDYPRIVQHLKATFPAFARWQRDAGLSERALMACGLGYVLHPAFPLFLQTIVVKGDRRRRCATTSWQEHPLNSGRLLKEERLPPFTLGSNDRLELLKHLPLLDLGQVVLGPEVDLTGRDLSFACLDGCVIDGARADQALFICYSSAVGLNFASNVSGCNAYSTDFTNLKAASVQLADWNLARCILTGTISNSVLLRWQVEDSTFGPNLSNTDLDECQFSAHSETAEATEEALALYNSVKRVYASRGRYHEAGVYHYLARCVQRKKLQRPWRYAKRKLHAWEIGGCWLAYLLSLMEWLWWGYGERPGRVLAMALSTILVAALTFFSVVSSTTYGDVASSLYFSVVTFSTLGYGDIAQTGPLRLLASFEALVGVFSMGLLVAGFSNKSRY